LPPVELLALAVVTIASLTLAARWDLLADEAYHWTWALRPGWGAYDQPPLIAWVLAAERAVGGDHTLALRAGLVVGWSAAVGVLLRWARDPALLLVLLAGLPVLAFLTKLAVPDALLLAWWAAALAAALGGRGWVLAGLCVGLASLSKYTGLLLFPLLLVAAEPGERRRALRGLAVGLLLLVPNFLWNATHGWQTVAFVLGEGVWSPHPPGWSGPPRQLLEQVWLAGPLVAGAGVAWAARPGATREERFAWWTSVPVFVLFAVAAVGGPPEAHWPAPAWIGVALGLSSTRGAVRSVARAGAVMAAATTLVFVAHVERPLVPLAGDPAARFGEGRVLAQAVVAAAAEAPDLPLLTERYQEASLLAWWTQRPAQVLPGCGRIVEGTDRPFDPPPQAWFVRPARSGPATCVGTRYGVVRGPRVLRGTDRAGRAVGPWDVFRIDR
jgi:4-amino-4-deoxy-L-arabinose transferase-like glycosyltransferase